MQVNEISSTTPTDSGGNSSTNSTLLSLNCDQVQQCCCMKSKLKKSGQILLIHRWLLCLKLWVHLWRGTKKDLVRKSLMVTCWHCALRTFLKMTLVIPSTSCMELYILIVYRLITHLKPVDYGTLIISSHIII